MDSKEESEKIYPTGYEPKENSNRDVNGRNQLNEILIISNRIDQYGFDSIVSIMDSNIISKINSQNQGEISKK